jgi:hypothetical protein
MHIFDKYVRYIMYVQHSLFYCVTTIALVFAKESKSQFVK